MKKILLPFLIIPLLISCNEDRFEMQDSSVIQNNTASSYAPFTYSFDVATRASLINSVDDLEDQVSTINIYGVQNDEVILEDTYNLETGETSGATCRPTGDTITFYAFPDNGYNMNFDPLDDSFSFTGTVGVTSNSTPDHLIAMTKAVSGEVSFELKHVFTAVNVVYKKLQAGHKISSVRLKNMATTGICTVDKSADTTRVSWSNLTGSSDMRDLNVANNDRISYVSYDGQELLESDCKFMTIPGQTINLEVVIDGVTVKTSCEPKKAGEYVTFYIKDNYDIDIEEGVVDYEEINKQSDDTYTLTIDTFVTGESSIETVTKPTNTIFVVDCSGSMVDPLSEGATSLAYHKKNSDTFDASNLDSSKPESYYSAVKAGGLFSGSRSVYYTDCRYALLSWSTKKGWGYMHETIGDYFLIPGSDYEFNVYKSKLGAAMDAIIECTKSLGNAGDNNTISIVSFPAEAGETTTAGVVIEGKNAKTNQAEIIEGAYKLFANGSTPADAGLAKAKDLLVEGVINNVIFITDGDPSHSSGFSSTVANTAVLASEALKDAGATVYSLGIFNASDLSDNAKTFMEHVSSNFVDCTSYTSGTAVSSDYYNVATSNETVQMILNNITQKIVTESLDYDGFPYVKFKLSEAMYCSYYSESLTFYSLTQEGMNGTNPYFDEDSLTDITSSIEIDFKGDWVIIKGFDYASNYCGKGREDKGKELRIVLSNIRGFYDYRGTGMNQVFDYGSGLYEGSTDTLIQDFSSLTIKL